MAELSDEDKKKIFGEDYKEPEITPESRAARAAAARTSRRNMAIGLGVMALVVIAAVLFGGGR